jgi:hypothetical protein
MSQDALKCPAGQNDLNGNCLSDKQATAIDMLVMGKTYQSIADALAVDRKTIYRWRQDEDFKEELSRRRRERWSAATDRLQSMIDDSLSVIDEQLHDRYERTRFRAAATVLRVVGLNMCMSQRRGDNDE